MHINEELEELIENFMELPEIYRHGVLDVVKDRRQLYEMEVILVECFKPPDHQQNLVNEHDE